MDDAPCLLPRVRAHGRRADDAEARRDAVVAHLDVLLNTRAGSSLLDASYGLPDLTDYTHASAPCAGQLARLLEACVRRHEPRLSNVTVRELPRAARCPLSLGFALTAALADGTPLRLHGSVGRGAQVALHAEDA